MRVFRQQRHDVSLSTESSKRGKSDGRYQLPVYISEKLNINYYLYIYNIHIISHEISATQIFENCF